MEVTQTAVSTVSTFIKKFIYAGVVVPDQVDDKRSVIVINSLSLLTGSMVYIIGLFIYSQTHSLPILRGVLIEGTAFFGLILLNKYHQHQTASFGMLAVHSFSAIYFGSLLGIILPVELVVAFLIMFLIGGSMVIFKEKKSRLLALVHTLLLLLILEANNYYRFITPIELKISQIFLFRLLCVGGMLVLIFAVMVFLVQENFRLLRKNEKLVDDLKNLDKKRKEFLRETCHEIRTPLNSIQGWIEVSKGSSVDVLGKVEHVEPERVISKISSTTNHLLNIVNRHLELAKIEAGVPTPVRISKFHTFKWATETYEMMLPQANDRGVDLCLNVDRAILPTYLTTDRTLLIQIATNLIKNAIKFTPVGKLVGFSAWIDPGSSSFNLSIKDDGPGIPDEILAEIYTPYVTGDSRIEEGTGLGMPLIKNYVHRLGGEIKIETSETLGTNVTVSIPQKREAEETQEFKFEIISPQKITAAYFAKKILVIDDDNMVHIMVKAAMTDSYVISARNGEQGLELAQSEQPEIILLDANMPDMRGLDVLKLLKSFPSTAEIPVAMVTSDVFIEAIQEYKQGGAELVIQKPLTIAAIKNSLVQFTIDRKQVLTVS